jgi:hypothetical protein
LESDGICRGIDLAGLADVELLHDERAPTVAAGTSAGRNWRCSRAGKKTALLLA